MQKIKSKTKKSPKSAKKKPAKKPASKMLTDLFRERAVSKKPKHKKPKSAQSYHDVSVPSSEFTQQLGSNYQPPEHEQNGQ
jgi:hypothetical protein